MKKETLSNAQEWSKEAGSAFPSVILSVSHDLFEKAWVLPAAPCLEIRRCTIIDAYLGGLANAESFQWNDPVCATFCLLVGMGLAIEGSCRVFAFGKARLVQP